MIRYEIVRSFLLQHDEQELNRKIAQLEILGELRNVQKIILEEEQFMALTYNIEKDIRYNQGLEKGLEKGIQKASDERNNAITANLVQHTNLTNEKISELVGVPLEFVISLRKQMLG